MKIKLVELNYSSLAECRRFVDFVNGQYQSPFPLSIKDTQSSKYYFYWAVDAQGIKVGASGLVPKTRYLAESVKSVVGQRFRGQGLGEQLSLLIEKQAKKLGYKKLMTTIYVTNLPMIFIKLKQGYLFEGFHPDHERPGLHEYSLGKKLV